MSDATNDTTSHSIETYPPFEIQVQSTEGFTVYQSGGAKTPFDGGGVRIDGTDYIVVQIKDKHTMVIAQPKQMISL